MKIFFTTLGFIMGISSVYAQKSFHISGTINGLESGIAELTYIDRGQIKQVSAGIKDGKFLISGSLPEEEKIIINFRNDYFNGNTSFFAGNENILIKTDTASLTKPVVEGASAQKDFEVYDQLVSSVNKRSDALNKTGSQIFLSGKLTEPAKDSLFKIRDDLDKEKISLIAAFAKEYPASVVSAWAISTFYGYARDSDELEPAYNALSKKIKTGLYGRQIKELIAAAKKTAIGKTAADFKVNDINGHSASLSGYKGKYVFVDFWASWCGPCRAENPNVVNVYSRYHSDKFDILGVSLDTDKDAWLKAIKNDNLAWTQVSELNGWKSNVVIKYGLKSIPFNMLLDKDGTIIAKNLRGAELEKKMREVLN